MLAPPSELGGVKVYNLSSVGKALPAWVNEKRKARQLAKKKRRKGLDVDEKLEVIQDLFFPTMCGRVKVSRDGGTLMATGGYPPQVRAFELRELSLKFSRHFESEVVQFQLLSPDWKKAVFLLADRSVEFHSQFGKHHVTRIPHHGRALAYQRETCDLLLGGASDEVYRLNLERGSFLAPLKTGASAVNTLAVHPGHGMLVVGTQDGYVQCWDPRQRAALGTTCPFDDSQVGRMAADEAAHEVTALRFDPRGLQLAVGTSTGHVALYDIRRNTPLLVKDHQYGVPVVDIKYHHTGHIISSDTKIVKVWEREGGKTFTTIQPAADVNDVAVFPDTGMIFAALETERLGAYFVPQLGKAPRWCHFLDNMTEEMEEAPASTGMYDDYKFVTREELEKLGLGGLIGTPTLRPYMHGFFVDARLHAKAVSLSQPFAYEQWRKERLAQKIEAKTAGRIAPVARVKPKVNAELAKELVAAPKAARNKKGEDAAAAAAAGDLLDDARFANLFNNPDFQIDRESEEYSKRHPHAKNESAARAAAAAESEDEESAGGEEEDNDDEQEVSSEESGSEGGGEEEDELSALRKAHAGRKRDATGREKPARPETIRRSGGSGGGSKDRSGGSSVRMIGLQQDVLKGSIGGGAVSSLPASASFGDRLAASSTSESLRPAGGASIVGNRELKFDSSSLKPIGGDEREGGKGQGRGKGKGKGKGFHGRGMGGSRGGGADEPGSSERRGMERGMLGPSKGKGKGGKGKGGKGGRGKGRR